MVIAVLGALALALALIGLIAWLDARAARKPFDRALAQVTEEARLEHFHQRVTRRVERANRNREGR